MPNVNGTFARACLILSVAVLMLPWPSLSRDQATPVIELSRSAEENSVGQTSALPTQNSDFQEILELIDQIEGKFPASRDMLTSLRGKLYRRERTTMLPKSPEFSLDTAADRRRRNDRREPLPGENLYSSCAGLKDRALISQLREIVGNQTSVDYTQARRYIFTKIDNHGGEVECVYTGRKGRYNSIPSDRDMNTEHTWPQSHGATGVAKSDIHHLFPTDSQANSTRGSLPFGDVSNPEWAEGGSECDGDVFEVRKPHRGNVARALFYFSVRYGKAIDRDEEATLRQWHLEDPVDAAERERCNQIENIQHNRNPFVDRPELVDQISDF